MRFYKYIKVTALALSFVILQNSVVLATTYKDVSTTHYAYEAISRISDLGYLVGNMSGNFEPNGRIDKFQIVDILSRISGYKDTGASALEKDFQDKAYEKNKAYLSLFSAKFTKWNSVRDRQIAYLLEKQILTADDLNQFVIMSQDGIEQLMALTREQAAVFLVKLLGKQNEAVTMQVVGSLYSDDSSIATDKKPYVYYMKSIGVMQGDQNVFSPRSAITKAAMSVMLDKVLNIMNGTTATSTPPPAVVSPPPVTVAPPATVSETVRGIITTIYDSYKVIQVTSNDSAYNNKMLKLSMDAEVIVDGYLKTFEDIKVGMTFSGLYVNGELTRVIAESVSMPEVTPFPTSAPTPVPTPTPTAVPTETVTAEGIITSITNDGYTKSFTLEMKLLNLRGEVYTEQRTFTLANDCQITKVGKAVDFVSVAKNDQAVVRFSGNSNVAVSISLEEKDRQFTGTLMAKKVSETTGAVTLTIEDGLKNTYDLKVVPNDTDIAKKGFGTATWKDLRIGDTVEIKAEYDTLLEVYASGVQSTLDGKVEAIYISATESYVMLKTAETKTAERYYVIPDSVDMYSIKIGSDIRVRLESREISSVTVLRDVVSNSATGYVSYVTRTVIALKQTTTSQVNSHLITYNSNTVFVDSKTGKTVTINEVKDNDSIYVVYTGADSKTAKTVTIFGN